MKKEQLEFNSKGKLLCVMLVVCVICVGGVAAVRDFSKRKTLDTESWKQEIAKYEKPINTAIPATSAEPQTAKVFAQSDITQSVPKPKSSDGNEKITLKSPVAGEIFKKFSQQQLIFSKTMNDWRTHNGVDIGAALETPVKACADGIVDSVYRDDLLGNIVVISHKDGTKTLYANLDTNQLIERAKNVKSGEVIGKIGNSAVSEIKEIPHLHFEVLKNGSNVDPEKAIT